ncbi:single-stranded DNA-binding protein [Microbacterium sp. STN6]|uniref:single-stranded DNA-binding protein n=1 Tax=Microbacterium sp. STN6 TaxID=2995588 RepID=UPI002260C2BD|nr:single-stranded DNA-binding protein [Microbacterium sp. STN6]MCX7522189.1 single-stranded DNA-binding protein [Microbacterium sp. STN6]
MSDTVTVTGVVASDVSLTVAGEGLHIARFRLASTQRRRNKSSGEWEDGPTNWYGVSAFRRLADNSATSLVKGERVVVTGRLRVREWETEGRKGTAIEIDADAIGHDLNWGTTGLTKSKPKGQSDAGGSDDGSPVADGALDDDTEEAEADTGVSGGDSFLPQGDASGWAVTEPVAAGS